MNLFHYTDVNAVKSILERKKLWLTDVRFLNDSTEMKEGFDIALAYLEHQGTRYPDSNPLQAAISYIKQVVYKRESYGLDRRPVFISSFSAANDLLSQWRAYGSYAIEFDSTKMNKKLSRCLYNTDEKSHETALPVWQCMLAIGQSLISNANYLDKEGQEALAEFIAIAATLKHKSFSEEQEYRVIMGHDVDPDMDDGCDVKYRVRGGLLIPYLELDIELDCVRSIVVGPMRDQELAYMSMRAFVKSVCMEEFRQHHSYIGDIDVRKSSTPFRV